MGIVSPLTDHPVELVVSLEPDTANETEPFSDWEFKLHGSFSSQGSPSVTVVRASTTEIHFQMLLLMKTWLPKLKAKLL